MKQSLLSKKLLKFIKADWCWLFNNVLMKKVLILLLLGIIANKSFAQNIYLIGNKSYKATPKIGFRPNSTNGIDFVILKKPDGSGLIALIGESIMGDMAFRGTSFLYLDDGTRISLIDRKSYDFKDETATTLYQLTVSEVQKLSEVSINTIRATMKCVRCISSSAEGTFTVTNTYGYYQPGLENSDRVDTAALVSSLFGE